jgi:RNA polymerase-binding transcription factor DksA
MDGIFLQSLEGLGEAPLVPTGAEVWEWLQGEKEAVAHEILSDGPLCRAAISGGPEAEASEEGEHQIEWRRRAQLETRLREIIEAQDRLMDGAYGRCSDCGAEIDSRRLAVDLAVPFCITCQKNAESEAVSCTL